MSAGCGARLAPGQHWQRCGETDMGQTRPVLCVECGGMFPRFVHRPENFGDAVIKEEGVPFDELPLYMKSNTRWYLPKTPEELAELYPSLQPHWRPYRYALDTLAPKEEIERARKAAWEGEEKHVGKGNKGSECNRTACTTPDASWYNMYTQRWYCEACAKRINQASTHTICDRR